jgi:hypothetical protein
MLPTGYICHSAPGRLRIRVPSLKGDHEFFAAVDQALQRSDAVKNVQTRPLTASILLTGDRIDAARIERLVVDNDLFRLEAMQPALPPIVKTLIAPIDRINHNIHRFTRGDVDVEVIVFLLLVGFGIYDLLRGDLRRPAWYTAFWYASEVFNKYISDHKSEKP